MFKFKLSPQIYVNKNGCIYTFLCLIICLIIIYLVFTKKVNFLFITYFLEDLQLINLLTMLLAESQ